MISNNLKSVLQVIKASANKTGRNPEDIKLVAVSKRFPPEIISEAYEAGQTIFGENYIQEIQAKRELIPLKAKIHFIGHLQSNKTKIAAQYCDMIETVDRLKLGKILNKHLKALSKSINILVQVNIGNDPNKSGIAREKTEELLIQLNQLSHLNVCGLMTITPFGTDPEQSRPYFRSLRHLSEDLIAKQLFTIEKPELSMGMSGDYQVAIEEGATIVRVGTAIFGERQY